MTKRRRPNLIVLFGVALIAATLLVSRCTPVTISGSGMVVQAVTDTVAEVVPWAAPPVLRSPHAVLVLDVSGSMQETDPEVWQRRAASEFFRVFSTLSREILDPQDTAMVAVVLYATTARLVNWGADASPQPWLPATAVGGAVFERALQVHLGDARADHRIGSRTDHLAALELVRSLVQDLPSPPAILFLTDGSPDPHALLSPFRTDEEARRMASSAGGSALVEAVTRERAEARRWIRYDAMADAKVGSPVLPRGLEYSARDRAEYAARVAESRSKLFDLRYAVAGGEPRCAVWLPFLLGPAAQAGHGPLADLFTEDGECRGEGAGEPVLLRTPSAMLPGFLQVLVPWFGLVEVDWPEGATSQQVPAETQAFAAVFESDAPLSSFAVTLGGRSYALSGESRAWAGVLAGGGELRISGRAPGRIRGRLLLKPRYDWVLLVPREIPLSPEGRPRSEIAVGLYSVSERRLVEARQVYQGLPGSLSAVLTPVSASGERHAPVEVSLDARQGGQGEAAYSTSVPGVAVEAGGLHVAVDLRPLGTRTPLWQEQLEQEVRLVPEVRVRIADVKGKETGLRFSRVPAEAGSVRRLLGRAGG